MIFYAFMQIFMFYCNFCIPNVHFDWFELTLPQRFLISYVYFRCNKFPWIHKAKLSVKAIKLLSFEKKKNKPRKILIYFVTKKPIIQQSGSKHLHISSFFEFFLAKIILYCRDWIPREPKIFPLKSVFTPEYSLLPLQLCHYTLSRMKNT